MYVYIYIERERDRDIAASLRTKILDFGGFDASRVLNLRGGIRMSTGNFPGI